MGSANLPSLEGFVSSLVAHRRVISAVILAILAKPPPTCVPSDSYGTTKVPDPDWRPLSRIQR